MATFCNIPSTIPSRYYVDNLDKAFDTYSCYEKRLIIGVFNTETPEPRINSFICKHELDSSAKEKTTLDV